MVSPMLNELTNCLDSGVISRVSEALLTVAQGLAKNPSLKADELLLYVMWIVDSGYIGFWGFGS